MSHPHPDRWAAPAPRVEVPNDVEFEDLMAWPDEIRVGDIYGGYVVTGIATAEHYREPALRITIFADPEMLHGGVPAEEMGRMVLRTSRTAGHKIPIERRVQR